MNNIEKNPNQYENKDTVINHLMVIEGNKISNPNGNLVFDVKTFIKSNWFKGEAIIATPEIPFNELQEQLTKELSICANNPTDPLDLKVITYISPKEINKSLELGIKNTHQMKVHLFAKEFFNSTPNAREIFYKQFFPKIGVFGEYELGYSA